MGSLVHAVLTGYGSGGLVMDVRNPLDENAGGGCRAAFLGLVKELNKYGHAVRAFSTFRESIIHKGIEYKPLEELDRHGAPNVMWACYDTRFLFGRSGMLRIGSHHTMHIGEAPFNYIDVNTIPSQASLDYLKPFWAPWSEWCVLPNAINDVPVWNPVPGRVIYHTSPDRGLHNLLQIWPEIRARVPDATLHIIGSQAQWTDNILSISGIENSEVARRARWVRQYLDKAIQAGGVSCFSNIPRSQMLIELSQANVFAFPCSVMFPCETFSASIMECCKTGVPVVLTPQDSLESIYKDHVLISPAPVEKHLQQFTDNVVHILKDKDTALHYSKNGKELASKYTYENAGKILNKIICDHTGFIPTISTSQSEIKSAANKIPEPVISKIPDTIPVPPRTTPAVIKSDKKLAFLLDPWGCVRPINPENCFTDSRGLTGSEVTCLMQAIEMAKLGHDVTMYSNFTDDREVHGIKFARWDRWQSESKNNWYAAFATIHPAPLQHLTSGTLRIFNQQVNDFIYCSGWEQNTDIVTALSHAHQKHLSQFSNFQNWRILPNGCDPSVYKDGPRNNKKLVFASSPDRGLHWLLELFPRLKKRVPDAECHIYYNFQENAAQSYEERGEPELANRFKYINLALPKLKNLGVFHHKSVSRQEIAKVFSEARILAYTCDPVRFTEGFSCTTLEAAVAGCLPVICGTDALGEIYGNFVPTTPAPYSKNRDHYFDNIVRYLTDDDSYNHARNKAKEMSRTHNWATIAKHLQAIINL